MNKKTPKVIWATEATVQLREAAAYIRQYSPDKAKHIRQEIKDATKRLAEFPLLGRVVPEFPEGLHRELIVGNYRIIYGVAEAHVEIVQVIHGIRDLLAIPFFRRRSY